MKARSENGWSLWKLKIAAENQTTEAQRHGDGVIKWTALCASVSLWFICACPFSSRRLDFGLRGLSIFARLLHRQNQRKHAPVIDDGFDGDTGFHFFGEFINHRKAETRAASRGH